MSAPKLPYSSQIKEINPEEFDFFRGLIFELAGISLSDIKLDLVRVRLKDRVDALKLADYSDYRDYLSGLPHGHEEFQEFINCLTTNKTSFFRESKQFDQLMELVQKQYLNQSNFKIWCAASSTGEEPYTLAMVLLNLFGSPDRFKIFASDIDSVVLSKAINGVYPRENLADIPSHYASQFIRQGKGEIANWFSFKKEIRQSIEFLPHNLIASNAPAEVREIDIVFCRNVLIYFDNATKENVLTKLANACKAEAFLFIGLSEGLQGLNVPWQQIVPSHFRKK